MGWRGKWPYVGVRKEGSGPASIASLVDLRGRDISFFSHPGGLSTRFACQRSLDVVLTVDESILR